MNELSTMALGRLWVVHACGPHAASVRSRRVQRHEKPVGSARLLRAQLPAANPFWSLHRHPMIWLRRQRNV